MELRNTLPCVNSNISGICRDTVPSHPQSLISMWPWVSCWRVCLFLHVYNGPCLSSRYLMALEVSSLFLLPFSHLCIHLTWHSRDGVECLSLFHKVSLPTWHVKVLPSHHLNIDSCFSSELLFVSLVWLRKGISYSEHVHLINRLYHFKDAIVYCLYLIFLFFETLTHVHNEISS